MRTNIEIDDVLMKEALEATGLGTKRAVVEHGLRLAIQLRKQAKLRQVRGKIQWDGDLDESRRSRFLED